MTTKSHNVAPFSRFSRMGFALGFKSNSTGPRPRNRNSGKVRENDDNWYIPYNGPYEAPKPTFKHEKERDSWGDSIHGEGDEEDDPILGDPELHNRYGVPVEQRPGTGGWHAGSDERKGRPRARTQSGVSGRTTSSGTVDPGRTSIGLPRRSTVSAGSNAPPIPSYISLDTSGGVGESPVPPQRVSRDTNSTRRKSLVSLFTFNTSSKKIPPSPKLDRLHTPTSPTSTPTRSRALSGASKRDRVTNVTRLTPDPMVAEASLRASGVTDDADYYDSYYSTLIQPQNNHGSSHQIADRTEDVHISNLRQPSPKDQSPTVSEPSSSIHPYAYAFSTMPPAETPLSAPPPKTHFDQRPTYRRYPESPKTVLPSQITNSITIPQLAVHPPDHNILKNSISTPELRSAKGATKKPSLPKMKDRWLSAETWCDALLFPRPRLKIKQDKASNSSGSGRIVSPPGSPVSGYFGQTAAPQSGVVSRVLAHSKSLMDLSVPEASGPDSNGVEVVQRVPPETLPAPVENAQQASSSLRPPRPKSWALDDLALPSPVPSLARVLEEGQILEHQRKKWQTQAIKSFQNERARSLSRARTKSLTSKQAKKNDTSLSTFDFLAARGLLGNQDMIAVNQAKTPRARADSQTESRGTVGKSSHGHSNSLSKTISKSSRSHSRNHSRSESIGKTAKKLVKATAKSTAALCVDETMISPVEEKGGIESVLMNNTTKVIRLADPAQMPLESALTTSRSDMSPSPSGLSDSRVGIALTTPPITDESIDRESIAMPAHPYAQGGFTSYAPASIPANDPRDFEYAGPHPSAMPPVQEEESHDLATRHRLPPQALHPYAQAGSSRNRDSYQSEFKVIPHARTDSRVPPADKMWAEWSSGVIREILPNEIVYSPFVSPPNSEAGGENAVHRQVRNSSTIYDTVGVGETLALAVQRRISRDSGLGTSEEQTFAQTELEMRSVGGSSGAASSRVYRSPVQYDVSQPPYLQKFVSPPAASSPLAARTPIQHLEAVLRQDSSETSVGNTSSSSSPPVSPPPLGDADDLETFRDLFYRPAVHRKPSADVVSPSTSQNPDIPWDVNSGNNQRGSGLTSIVRQISEELVDARGRSLVHSISLSSRSSLSALRQSAHSARTPPADANLQFVFSDIQQATSGENEPRPSAQGTIAAFQPSIQIPEDVESSRASSPMVSPVENDELDAFRLGHVESVSTPPAVSGDYRASFTGQMAFANAEITQRETEERSRSSASPFRARPTVTAHSSLQPSSADPTRSSYMTTSDGSRMSGLSDFPAPPPQPLTPAHMSLLSSYFDETLTAKELAEVQAHGQLKSGPRSRSGSVLTSRPEARSPPDVPNGQADGQSRRLTFGGNEEIDDLLASLSSHT